MDHFLATRPSFNKTFIVYFVRIRLICMCTVSTMCETWMLDVNYLEPKLSVATSVVEWCYAVGGGISYTSQSTISSPHMSFIL